MTRRFLTSTAVAAGLVALSAGALSGCREAAHADAPPPPPTVTVANPIVQVAPGWTEYSGRFVAVNAVDVRPRISGYLKSAHFHDGDYVREGQLLFTLDPLPAQAKVDRSSAELLQAEARLDRALADLKRAETLRAADAISAEELDSRREAAAQARAAKAAAEAAVRADKLDLGYTRIYAPISGRISDRRVDPGNLVRDGETVLTQIVSVDPIHFEFSAPDGVPLSGSQEVLVKLEGEREFGHRGRLDFVDNRIDPASGALRARAVFDNRDGKLTSGQFARVRVLTKPEPVLLAPDAAIAVDQSRRYVLVVGAGDKVEQRPVEVGPKLGELRIIRSGLSARDRIIINGQQRAMPGAPVKPEAGKIAAASAQPQG